MQVIDLLNKIANDKEIPSKIKHRDLIYEYQEEDRDYAYIDKEGYYAWFLNEAISDITSLTDEVELIENEIDIQAIEEYQTTYTERCIDKEVRDYINKKILPAIKQLDNKISNLQSN